MTNLQILNIAIRQSAIDMNCAPEEFTKQRPVIVTAGVSPDARKYLKQPFAANFVSYGSNIVASVTP